MNLEVNDDDVFIAILLDSNRGCCLQFRLDWRPQVTFAHSPKLISGEDRDMNEDVITRKRRKRQNIFKKRRTRISNQSELHAVICTFPCECLKHCVVEAASILFPDDEGQFENVQIYGPFYVLY